MFLAHAETGVTRFFVNCLLSPLLRPTIILLGIIVFIKCSITKK